MQNHPTSSPCSHEESPFERLKYYFGKMLTARDFEAEQNYMNEKRWLVNRLGIGWGVLCGLRVRPCPTQTTQVVVEPGFALDAYGHEILVCKQQIVDLKQAEGTEKFDRTQERSCFYIYLKYFECDVEPSPVPVEECETTETDCVYNRTQESFKIFASGKPPDWKPLRDPAVRDDRDCGYDCYRFLEDPCMVMIDHCGGPDPCAAIPLARICVSDDGKVREQDIDNCDRFRKLAYSNEFLFELFHCLKEELWKAHGARYDRKPFVPLLAHTIKGLHYKDGKTLTIPNAGTRPVRLTADGHHGHLWITDAESSKLICIDRKNSAIVSSPVVDLKQNPWGIAFDGRKHLWITHPEARCITRLNVCDVGQYTTIKDIPEQPQEILYDGTYIWVSHGWSESSALADQQSRKGQSDRVQRLSKIDPEQSKVLATYEVRPTSDCRPASPIVSMVFDGAHIWVAYTVDLIEQKPHQGSSAIAQRIDIDNNGFSPQDPTVLDGHVAASLCFDGTHVWATHDDGGNKLDIKEPRKLKEKLDTKEKQNAMAFDGCFLWTAEIGDGEAFVNRVDLLSAQMTEGEEICNFDSKAESYHISEMCFDGVFLWLAAYVLKQGQNLSTGMIHRLLP